MIPKYSQMNETSPNLASSNVVKPVNQKPLNDEKENKTIVKDFNTDTKRDRSKSNGPRESNLGTSPEKKRKRLDSSTANDDLWTSPEKKRKRLDCSTANDDLYSTAHHIPTIGATCVSQSHPKVPLPVLPSIQSHSVHPNSSPYYPHINSSYPCVIPIQPVESNFSGINPAAPHPHYDGRYSQYVSPSPRDAFDPLEAFNRHLENMKERHLAFEKPLRLHKAISPRRSYRKEEAA